MEAAEAEDFHTKEVKWRARARISGDIKPGARVYVGIIHGVLTTDKRYANPDYPDAIGEIEGAVLKLTPLGEKILANGQ